MQPFDAPLSMFAPLVIGFAPDSVGDKNQNHPMLLLWDAAELVPPVPMRYWTKKPGSLRRTSETRMRRTGLKVKESAAPFVSRIRLADMSHPLAPVANAKWGATIWEIGLHLLGSGSALPAIPEGYDVAVLDLVAFRLEATGFAGGPQLALLRHLWVESVKTRNPTAIVFGGQHAWSDSWWSEAQTSQEDVEA